MKKKNNRIYTIVDLFAGAGGLSYGFLQTGRFVVKAAFENDRHAQATYQRNHGDAVVYDDVADALSDEVKNALGNVDVVIGGPPCQGFSNANRQKNHAISQNNSLVKKFVQAVIHLNPAAFVMENVSMLQSNTHLFYVDKHDKPIVRQYGIKTSPAVIPLLEPELIFDEAEDVVSSPKKINTYLWKEDDYLALNVIYRNRNNSQKLVTALEKHRRRLSLLAERLLAEPAGEDHVLQQGHLACQALQKYYSSKKSTAGICEAIKPALLLQRMLSKAKEVHENKIAIEGYSTERGLVVHVNSMLVIDYIHSILSANGYSITKGILSAAAFGAPQKRMRFVMMGVKNSIAEKIALPEGNLAEKNFRTVADAIMDLEDIEAVTEVPTDNAGTRLPARPKGISKLGSQLRDSKRLHNHVITATTPHALERFTAIQQGDNFHSLPPELKTTYSDARRTQKTIYMRLKYDEPSGTVVNVRKSMWIHPVRNRALSIREAARLQTFPDSFVFCGTKDSQYQQVGNAVPPVLAKALAECLCAYLDMDKKRG